MNIPVIKRIVFYLLIIGVSGILLYCVKPVEPEPNPPKNLVTVTVNAVAGKAGVYQIGFTKDVGTWNQNLVNRLIMYNIYRKPVESDTALIVARSFGDWPGFDSGDVLTYTDSVGKVHGILHTRENFIYDTVNIRNLEQITYGVGAVTNLTADPKGIHFSLGYRNQITYSDKAFGGGFPSSFTIDKNAPETPDRIVTISGQVDTAGIDAIICYRYSEILHMDSLVDWLIRIDSLKSSPTVFKLQGNDSILVNADSTITLYNTKGTTFKKTYFYQFGKLGRTDTILRQDFPTYFETFEGDPTNSMIRFSRTDTLVDGIGKKWIMLRGIVRNAGFLGFNPLFDDIDIRGYVTELILNLDNANTRTNEYEKKICLLDDAVPFYFRTFGDTTFSESVYIWIATRNLTAKFFNEKYQIIGHAVATYDTSGTELKVFDCILESRPEKFKLNTYGEIADLLVDFDKEYRVSPMGNLDSSGSNANLLKGNLDGLIERSEDMAFSLTRSVKLGSIFGYDTVDLNQFRADTVYTFSATSASKNAEIGPGWHVVADSQSRVAAFQQIMGTADFLVERIQSLDKVTYINPFRNLPLNVSSIREGSKEFILLAFSRGRFFNEPRVTISRLTTGYKCVWDKIPPEISWAEEHDPAVTIKYAPMFYEHPTDPSKSRITNLTSVNNIFDVYLTGWKQKDGDAAVRDGGLGEIKSVKLCLHHAGTPYTVDPVTSMRQYADGSPIKQFSLDGAQIQQQTNTYYMNDEKVSYSIVEVFFKDINVQNWQSGIWDMWIETEDDLKNVGIAPLGRDQIVRPNGTIPVRQIEIK